MASRRLAITLEPPPKSCGAITLRRVFRALFQKVPSDLKLGRAYTQAHIDEHTTHSPVINQFNIWIKLIARKQKIKAKLSTYTTLSCCCSYHQSLDISNLSHTGLNLNHCYLTSLFSIVCIFFSIQQHSF